MAVVRFKRTRRRLSIRYYLCTDEGPCLGALLDRRVTTGLSRSVAQSGSAPRSAREGRKAPQGLPLVVTEE